MTYLLVPSLFAIGYGIWAMRRSAEIAEKNQKFIDSGDETYFEQRRSWEAYGTTPSTDAREVSRRGRKELLFGVFGLILTAIFYILD